MIERAILSSLKSWKSSETRKPLILRGARQVGKSYVVREFGKKNFANTCEVNFEREIEVRKLFESRDPKRIIQQLSLLKQLPINESSTLLFLDEIQDCPDAIVALRYFFEELPDLAIVATGSFIDIVLNSERELSFPVGRVENLNLTPINFLEFLKYHEKETFVKFINTVTIKTDISSATHLKLLELFGNYLLCGGMPLVVKSFKASPTNLEFKQIQTNLLKSFQDDFRKYRSRINFDRLDAGFRALATISAKRFKYTDFLPDATGNTARNILSLFEQAKIITPVYATHSNGLPLGSEVDEREHKFIFVDSGLLTALAGWHNATPLSWNFDLTNSGFIGEQIVGQELISYATLDPQATVTGSTLNGTELYFWRRNKIGASAEVDYLIVVDGKIIPLEVKAGTTGRLKSIRSFMKDKKVSIGVRVSQHPLSYIDGILSVPFYAISQISRLVKDML